MSNPEQVWRIGQLAQTTGVTVRTLHHYARVGTPGEVADMQRARARWMPATG